ncbi:MAG: GGDEF domain-containing protein [Elusimicrobiota bacterium]
MRNRHVFSFFGALVGLIVPMGWFVWRGIEAKKSWWLKWINTELTKHGESYIPITLIAILIFVIIGYLIGKYNDDILDEAQTIQDHNHELNRLATTDQLTGLLNSRYIHQQLDIIIENSHKLFFSCLLIDIDYFKKVNDTYGHPIGDLVLIQVAKILKQSVRWADLVGRLGGEEFIIILTETNAKSAYEIAERIRERVHMEKFIFDDHVIHSTISIGITTFPSRFLNGKNDILRVADEMLYKAKKSGRNKTITWEEPQERVA